MERCKGFFNVIFGIVLRFMLLFVGLFVCGIELGMEKLGFLM